MTEPQKILPRKRRPKCRWCSKPMRPNEIVTWERVDLPDGQRDTVRNNTGTTDGYGYGDLNLFCTLRHGFQWACWRIRKEQEDDS